MTNSNQNFVTIAEFLELAMQFEADSAEFYTVMKQMVSPEDTTTQELLNLLIREENEHRNTLRRYDIGPANASLLQFPPSFSFSMPGLPQEAPGLEACIEIGLLRERKSVEIYTNAAAMTTGDFQRLLQGLAAFEQRHVEKLSSLQRFFQ